MHSVYMTHNPCVYNPSLHVYTQSVQNPASMGGDPVRDRGCSREVRFTQPSGLWGWAGHQPGGRLPAHCPVFLHQNLPLGYGIRRLECSQECSAVGISA